MGEIMQGCKVNILGTEYQILTQSESENPKLRECTGLCEQYAKKIVLHDSQSLEEDVMCVENYEEFAKKVLRHEIIHAFFGEAGLRECSEYAENEELVDWLAVMTPKIFKVFQELDLL